MFKKGDLVICEDYGKGTVVAVTKNKVYPIEVFFESQDSDNSPVKYTSQGSSLINTPPTLKIR